MQFEGFILDTKGLSCFHAKVNKRGPKQPHMKTRCWDWTGAKGASGHPRIGQMRGGEGVTIYAHRLALRLKLGKLSSKAMACHKCDYPPCTRPSHLFKGTNNSNMADMAAKGRAANRGEKSWSAVLSEKDIIRIRKLIHKDRSPDLKLELAERYNVSLKHIQAIARGKFWPHVGGPITKRGQ